MTVDLLIPAYRPDGTFCLLLQKLRGQTFAIRKLLIVNTEKALWEEARKRYPIDRALAALPFSYDILHISKAAFDHGGTRNFAAGHSDADILIFMTQDAVPADAFLLEHLIEGLETPGGDAAVAYARQLPARGCSAVERYTRNFNYPDRPVKKGKRDIPALGIKTFFCSDVCAAYRREVFEALGGFEAPAIFNEDMLFAAKAVMAGYFVSYAAKARVVHSHNYSMMQQLHRNFDLAVSQKQHPEVFAKISSESEGMRLVANTAVYLLRIGKPWLIVELLWHSMGKYAGYLLGKRYKRLGRGWILRLTANPGYWKRLWAAEDGAGDG